VKAVLDTNVLVAAFLAEGVCKRILQRARDRQFTLVFCPVIRTELTSVLMRKAGATRAEIAEVIALLEEISVAVDPGAVGVSIRGVCRDGDDDRILECACGGEADYLVSGDKDLLALGSHRGVVILSPRDFELLFPE
jgi:putative PIN family toxin of toxin-antitoxin system